MAFLQITNFTNTNYFTKLNTFIYGFMNAYSKWSLYRQTVSELQCLNSRELSDLGINKSMIRTVAKESVYKGN